ncbi:hypothetical protein BDR26DRAFT_850946 [Obelidium mucronatum]|nr:hypothetical protein BDR26DRAFT_850946 [Obelidium mucronatum]
MGSTSALSSAPPLANPDAAGDQRHSGGSNSTPSSDHITDHNNYTQSMHPMPQIGEVEYMMDRRPRPVPCTACKSARKKCDLSKPHCRRCLESGLSCSYVVTNRRYARRLPHIVEQQQQRQLGISHMPIIKTEHADDYLRHSLSQSESPEYSDSCSEAQNPIFNVAPHGYQHHPHPNPHPNQQPFDHPKSSSASMHSNGSPKIPDYSGALPPAAEVSDVDLAALAQRYQNEIAALTKRPLPCDACRSQKKRCDRLRPSCTSCIQRGLNCEYILPPKKATQAKWRARLVLENAAAAAGAGSSVSTPAGLGNFSSPEFSLVPFAVRPSTAANTQGASSLSSPVSSSLSNDTPPTVNRMSIDFLL